ncbi:GAF domain-containing protein [Actinocorallia herbida]|uniref:GAF domain-containing protein n=1 Tax=Actinocorallia herbida TaxID=58109 RepID=A0A3N1CZP7_9ACTN|nr:LuxR C-terminal-related transcriptional regulator [Actinocorallia herbida]ROO86749.1 GAF domain-containing protein [Actinocorallia herbida]
MPVDLMRPSDLALLKQTSREIRQALHGSVTFAGLRKDDKIRITAVAGAGGGRLTSIVLAPARGLGGRSWQIGRALAVDDYAAAEDITHDFDDQILGEGIVSLAVAPIIVRRRVRGLLYAGRRTRSGSPEVLRFLEGRATHIAHELNIRDEVDDRLRLIRAADLAHHDVPTDLVHLHARLRELAHRVADPEVAAELRALAAPHPDPARPSGVRLTDRQIDILALIALGLKNTEIATRLGLSLPTVKSYLREAMARLHATTRQAAVVAARLHGLLP